MLTIILGISLALLVNKKEVKGKKFFRSIYLLPWAVPAFLTILIFQIFFSKIGAANTIIIPFFTGNEYAVSTAVGFLQDPFLAKITIILIQAWLGFPFVFILTTGVLQGIPDDLYEAASIDGASSFQTLLRITLPMLRPALAIIFLLRFLDSIRTFDSIYILTGGGPGTTTQTVGIYIYKTAFIFGDFGLAASAAIVLVMLLAPFMPSIIRQFNLGTEERK
jgi:arabinogalactan oligomer/maltooligosaccharide transport system permease protein